MTNDVMRIICLITARHAFGAFLPSACRRQASLPVVVSGAGDTEPVTPGSTAMLTTVFPVAGFAGGRRQRRKILCAALYAGGGLLSRHDVAFTVH